jgi:hypothetical protein
VISERRVPTITDLRTGTTRRDGREPRANPSPALRRPRRHPMKNLLLTRLPLLVTLASLAVAGGTSRGW